MRAEDAEEVAEQAEAATDPVELIQRMAHRGLSIATAESLTAGALAARIADVPGASVALLGGVVAYCNEVKQETLGVDAQLLEARGAVDGDVAAQMALGAAASCHAELGISTTGVAGPEPHQGKPVGTVYVGISAADGVVGRYRLSLPEYCTGYATDRGLAGFRLLQLDGDRASIRQASVEAALKLVRDLLHTEPAGLPEAP
ncbi:CinA family protein [Nesterenkonia ebinurensis]|uniref:CinA family protein n=1 Tax=Nesterenkonia ebinurensis TaxID=2608252 RepID=UPI00168B3AB1|nr:CinA family protein [Nesterenkonia ebinurensis]